MSLKERRLSIKNIVKNLFSAKKMIQDVNGVYLGQARYLRVIDQPRDKPAFVSGISNVATNFQLASRYGNIGLIAHNYLGGRHFLDLKIGERIFVMNGRRERQCYQVAKIHRFQALDPRSPRSDFIDLDTRLYYSVNEVFKRVYTGDHHLVLQTCIEKGNIKEWGRIFIIAYPVRSEFNQFVSEE